MEIRTGVEKNLEKCAKTRNDEKPSVPLEPTQ